MTKKKREWADDAMAQRRKDQKAWPTDRSIPVSYGLLYEPILKLLKQVIKDGVPKDKEYKWSGLPNANNWSDIPWDEYLKPDFHEERDGILGSIIAIAISTGIAQGVRIERQRIANELQIVATYVKIGNTTQEYVERMQKNLKDLPHQ